MAGLILKIDPTAEGTGTQLLLTDTSAGWSLVAFDPGQAQPEYQLASSVDTEGSLPVSQRHQNTEIAIALRIQKSTAALLRTALDDLGKKIGKIFKESGTFELTLPDGTARIADLVGGDSSLTYVKRFINLNLAEVALRLPRLPYWRGAATQNADRTETTLPALIATETGILGDVPAGSKWVIDNDAAAGNDWWGLIWGVETNKDYTFTDFTGGGGLFYEAESRTAMGGSATAVGPSGASGGGSNVMRNTALGSSYQAILSTQASGAGAHLSHVGTFRVWARVQVPTTNTGTVSVACEYGTGDFRRFTGPPTMPERTIDPLWEGTWRRVDLGLVTIPKIAQGTQRWECRILAKSTVAGDDVDIDWIKFVPVDEGSGLVSAILRTTTPTSFAARDEFDQTAGALTGKVAPVGGTWTVVASSDADDFNVSGAGVATRTAVSDADMLTGRMVTPGTTDTTGPIAVRGDFKFSAFPGSANTRLGVVARVVDINNYIAAVIRTPALNSGQIDISIRVAGVELGTAVFVQHFQVDTNYTVQLLVDGAGRWFVWFKDATLSLGEPIASGWAAGLATGGAIDSGRYGIYDAWATATACTRTVDNFAVWVPPADAAVFAGQSLEIRHDQVIRKDSGGSFWQPPSSYEGDYLRVPSAGAEARSARFIMAPLYHPESNGVWLDDRMDDQSARLTFTPRYLS